MKPQFERKNAEILGISFDEPKANAAFAERHAFNFPLLCDESRSVGLAYGACDDAGAAAARRISYVIGPDGRVRRAYPKVEPARHPQQVLGDLP